MPSVTETKPSGPSKRARRCFRVDVCALDFICVCLVAVVARPVNAQHIIDDFTGTGSNSPWPMTLNAQNTNDLGFEDGTPGVLGNHRQSAVGWNPMSSPGSSVHADILTAAGVFDYQTLGLAFGGVELVYGGGNGLNLDMTGVAGVRIDFPSLDFGVGTPMVIRSFVWDGTPNEEGTAEIVWNLSNPGAQSVFLPRKQFEGDPVNWATIQLVVFSFGVGSGADYQISQISTYVPGPGGIAVFAVAVIGTRRRRK